MNTRVLAIAHKPAALIGAVAVVAVAATFAFSAFFAKAEVGPEITTTIHNSAHATITESPIGSVVHAHALVATTTSSTTPTGTVDFRRYANTSCSGDPAVEAGVALTGGEAESATTTTPASGLSYITHYNGDADNAPSDSVCRILTATAPDTSITTTLSTTTVFAGGSVHDNATLNNETANASGTVAYSVYTNSACTLGAQSAGTKTVVDGSVPDSNTIQFNTPGTFYWQAVYSGDLLNAAATSSCASEVLTVLATTTDDDDDGDDNGNDHEFEDNGKHKGFIDGLPPGIFKKLLNEGYTIPLGIMKRFGDNLQSFFHDSNDNDSDEDENENDEDEDDDNDNNRGNSEGKGNKGDSDDD
ncbi:hypothetical protein A2943_02370 [Candidatus Adlerbacteria bacterium RIFCSPLOWO2_01_FULL_51_16]|uniref:Bacterial Ig-like domain-containing protein n=1 Tax=Candidatus Adlerbacteria bacterium RIFCSPLOWO2_01_FULL_51_16 TaxID=1797243 RepID=A0A1F4XGA5_9BACT|nr:MAG: hypothetical protein A2943_02370 [Candidatus Adlerbacteria bacterium RIFCSPLOWO2_01_FULL_51_16]